jgi:hypothetical protein
MGPAAVAAGATLTRAGGQSECFRSAAMPIHAWSRRVSRSKVRALLVSDQSVLQQPQSAKHFVRGELCDCTHPLIIFAVSPAQP